MQARTFIKLCVCVALLVVHAISVKAQDSIALSTKPSLSQSETRLVQTEIAFLWDASDVRSRFQSNTNLRNAFFDLSWSIFQNSTFFEPVNNDIKLFYSYAMDAFIIMGSLGEGTGVRWLDGEAAARMISYESASNDVDPFKVLFVERAGMAKLVAAVLNSNTELRQGLVREARSKQNADRIIARLANLIAARDRLERTGCIGRINNFMHYNKEFIASRSRVSGNIIDNMQYVMPAKFREGDVVFMTDSLMGRVHVAMGFDATSSTCSPVFRGFMYSIWPN